MFFKALCIILGLFGISQASPLSHTSKEENSDYFIVGGVEAPEKFAPHMAAIIVGDDLVLLLCGGSIISPRYILTAAHCIQPFIIWGQLLETYRTVVGTNDWYHGRGITKRIEDVHIHPKYDEPTLKYDVGLLKLKESLQMSDAVGIISMETGWVSAGERSFATGWGRLQLWGIVPFRLQLLHMNTISPEQCIEGVRNASTHHGEALKINPEIELCTLHSVGHGMCNGDSGSALVSMKTLKQIGIVSWGFACAVGAPDVFVRISGVIDWIKHYIEPNTILN